MFLLILIQNLKMEAWAKYLLLALGAAATLVTVIVLAVKCRNDGKNVTITL